MKTVVYYFSATGNSLSIAKKIGQMLPEAELVSIPKVFNTTKLINAKKVGFVFPIYAWGMPRMVKEFIEQAKFENVDYCFSVIGSTATAGKTNEVLSKMLKAKNVSLDAGFLVKEPSNAVSVDESSPMLEFMRKTKGNREHHSIDTRFGEIKAILANSKKHNLEKDAWFMSQISNTINKATLNVFKSQDKNFWVTDACNGCGICTKVCPRNNINMVDSKPSWKHNCENCVACINWCPTQALQSGEGTEGKKRYHKEGIELKELL